MSLTKFIPRPVKQQIRTWQHQAQARKVLRAHKQARKATLRPHLDCALVIPVHNDAVRLKRLLTQAREMDCFSQIVVVDDGSDTPITDDTATIIRHDTARGAGPARNAGLDAVATKYLLYFDSDDLLTKDLPNLLSDLGATAQAFDFCLFKHADSRTVTEGHWGQPAWDEAHWRTAGLAIGTLQSAPHATWPTLAKTANYPWNKIYQTAFLRDNNIGCAETPVHEDITLHWLGFLAAKRVLVSDRVCAWHLVGAGRGHQTNRKGAERLTVFDALAPVVTAADTKGDAAFQASLVSFVMELMHWIRDHLDPSLHTSLDAAEKAWLQGDVEGWRINIAKVAPDLDAAITARLTK